MQEGIESPHSHSIADSFGQHPALAPTPTPAMEPGMEPAALQLSESVRDFVAGETVMARWPPTMHIRLEGRRDPAVTFPPARICVPRNPPLTARTSHAGGIGGACGVIAGQPLDTIRIRQQQPGYSGGAALLARSIVAVEGLRSLFRGMGFPLCTAAMQVCFCRVRRATDYLQMIVLLHFVRAQVGWERVCALIVPGGPSKESAPRHKSIATMYCVLQ